MVAFVTATINASSEPRDDLALNAIALRISSVTALLLNVPPAVSGASAAIAAPTAMTADHASSDSFMISPGSAANHAPCAIIGEGFPRPPLVDASVSFTLQCTHRA